MCRSPGQVSLARRAAQDFSVRLLFHSSNPVPNTCDARERTRKLLKVIEELPQHSSLVSSRRFDEHCARKPLQTKLFKTSAELKDLRKTMMELRSWFSDSHEH